MRKTKITVGIITKNEEANIAGCIERVKGWADEIIVVDGYSEDRTASLAESLGAKVVKHGFLGDFAVERNKVIENATGDWVLHLDADERVTDGFKKAVDAVIDRDENVDIYKFKRKNFFLGRLMENGGFCHYIPNLVRRNTKFEGVLHERPVSSKRIGVIEADIEHYPFKSITQFMTRHNRYSDIESEKMFEMYGSSKLNETRKNAVGRTLKLIWKMYFKKKGYKDGMHGLIFSILFAFTNFLIWTKYWELCQTNMQKNPKH